MYLYKNLSYRWGGNSVDDVVVMMMMVEGYYSELKKISQKLSHRERKRKRKRKTDSK